MVTDTEMTMVMGDPVDTAQVTRDTMIETGDKVATMLTHGPVGRQAKIAVNHHQGETGEEVIVVLAEIEIVGRQDMLETEERMKGDKEMMIERGDIEKRENVKRRGRGETMNGNLRRRERPKRED